MKTLLVFVDEAFSNDRSYSQISGFLITPANYLKLRKEVLAHYSKRYKAETGNYLLSYLPGYHSNDFCPQLSDPDKIKEYSFLLRTIYAYAGIVFIHGIHSTESFSEAIPAAKEGYLGSLWFTHLQYLNSYAKTNCIIPIIDLGLNKSYERMYHLYSSSHNNIMGAVVSREVKINGVENFGNILEPLFCKDEYSIGVQMADLIGAYRWTNTKLFPSGSISKFKAAAIAMFRKYIKRKKTNCYFYTISIDPISKESEIQFHDSFIAGAPVLNDNDPNL